MTPSASPSSLAISAVICTHNRLTHAERAVASLLKQTLPANRYEILVIDNGSTDGTAEAVARIPGSEGRVRVVSEPVLGLSRARNTGWREAGAAIIAYLDDDAVAAPQWLERILAAFDTEGRTGRPIGVVGGKVEGNWEVPRPRWLHDALLTSLTVVDWGDRPFVVEPPRFVVGANIAFRRDLLERLGGFAENLGRKGNLLLSAEEREMTSRIEALGFATLYAPDAMVKHWVGKERLTQSWFLERAHWQGVSEAVAEMNATSLTVTERRHRARKRLFHRQVLKNRLLALAGNRNHPRLFVAHVDLARARAYADTMRNGAPAEIGRPHSAPMTMGIAGAERGKAANA